MAGLLEWFEGDDKVKDADGRTQADRREPYYMGAGAGLGRIGGLLMAAGMPMHNEQRAQLMAQAGNAFGGIPGDIIAAREAQSKGILQQQTVTANRTKLANQAKVQAYANSPEGQKALAGLKPHEQFAAKVALDSGDVDAFSKIMNGVGTHEARAAALGLREQKLELDRQKQENAGPMKGTGEQQQMWNWLMQEPADSQKYAMAYNHFSRERSNVVNGVAVREAPLNLQEMGYSAPTWRGNAASGPAGAGTPAHPPAPPAGQVAPLPGGREIETSADGSTVTITNADESQEVYRGTMPVRRIDPPKLDEVEQRKVNDLKAMQAKVITAADAFKQRWKAATPADRAKALAGFPSPLTGGWTNLALLVKEAGIYNLGVITGPDLGLLQRAIADPSSMKSLGVTPEEMETMVGDILRIQESGIRSHEKSLYKTRRKGTTPPAPAPGGGGQQPVQGADGVWRLPP